MKLILRFSKETLKTISLKEIIPELLSSMFQIKLEYVKENTHTQVLKFYIILFKGFLWKR